MGSCHFDNFSCYLWLKFHQQEFISISVIHAKSVQKGHNSIDNALELCPFLHQPIHIHIFIDNKYIHQHIPAQVS